LQSQSKAIAPSDRYKPIYHNFFVSKANIKLPFFFYHSNEQKEREEQILSCLIHLEVVYFQIFSFLAASSKDLLYYPKDKQENSMYEQLKKHSTYLLKKKT